MYWADEIAQTILKREKSVYRVHDYKTPSGRIHVGALCGVIIHGVVARALEARGTKTEFTYGFDDYDPMDGFPVYLPESFRQYMGMPLSEIPSPEPGYANFGEYYAKEFTSVFNALGFYPTIVWGSEMYKSGQYNESIRIVLDKADMIRRIYKETSGSEKPNDWHAVSVLCPNCGRIGTTRVYAWDGELVSFKCEPSMVTWAQGCGFDGQISPFDGNAKLPYKPETAAKWYIFDEVFETAGKDHMTKGGSFAVAAEIAKQVFNIEPPFGREFPYEWLLINGKKMSSSKGVGYSAKDVSQLLPNYLLTFFIAKSKPNRQRDFSPEGMAMPLLYDEYDRAIAAYHTEPESDLAQVISYTKTADQIIPQYTMRFSKVAFLTQMPNIDIWSAAALEKGSPLSPEDKIELEGRISYAKVWLDRFAPEEARFTLQQQLPTVDLTDEQRLFLQSILTVMKQSYISGAELHEKIHEIKGQQGINPKEAFSIIYQIFLGKDSGPQVGWFLAALDQNFVINRLEEATRG